MISVITCSHNPRKEFFVRVADALKMQTLTKDQWEWIIVDNQSTPMIHSWLDASWHPEVRIVREDELGLTPARLRGIREARHSLLVFVDDDNVLDPNYLEIAETILCKYPNLGAVGGSTEGEFEVAVPEWFSNREFEMLGVRPISEDYWGNQKGNWQICPIGAGMVLRSEVAREYARRLQNDSQRRQMDRRGNSLVSGGDVDMANMSFDLGLGIGRFSKLRLLHLIPRERMTVDYLVRLATGIGFSRRLLSLINTIGVEEAHKRWFMHVSWIRPWIVRLRKPIPTKRIEKAFLAGANQADSDWRRNRVG